MSSVLPPRLRCRQCGRNDSSSATSFTYEPFHTTLADEQFQLEFDGSPSSGTISLTKWLTGNCVQRANCTVRFYVATEWSLFPNRVWIWSSSVGLISIDFRKCNNVFQLDDTRCDCDCAEGYQASSSFAVLDNCCQKIEERVLKVQIWHPINVHTTTLAINATIIVDHEE